MALSSPPLNLFFLLLNKSNFFKEELVFSTTDDVEEPSTGLSFVISTFFSSASLRLLSERVVVAGTSVVSEFRLFFSCSGTFSTLLVDDGDLDSVDFEDRVNSSFPANGFSSLFTMATVSMVTVLKPFVIGSFLPTLFLIGSSLPEPFVIGSFSFLLFLASSSFRLLARRSALSCRRCSSGVSVVSMVTTFFVCFSLSLLLLLLSGIPSSSASLSD